jgi:hypothetical protein
MGFRSEPSISIIFSSNEISLFVVVMSVVVRQLTVCAKMEEEMRKAAVRIKYFIKLLIICFS